MKNKVLTLTLFCLSLLFINSCKTDPKVDPQKGVQEDTSVGVVPPNMTVSMRHRKEVDYINPLLTYSGEAIQVCSYMFPTLLDYDPFKVEITPVIAKSRPVIEEVKEGERAGWVKYTFEIREEAVWDDGSPVIGKDYAFAMKALFNPHLKLGAPALRGYLGLIRDVELDPANPKKFAVFTNEKYIIAEYAVGLFILPEHKYDPDKVLAGYTLGDLRNPKLADQFKKDETLKSYAELFSSAKYTRDPDFIGGCGAYKLEEWIPGERIVLVRKDNWWGDKVNDEVTMLKANPKKLIFRPVSDGTTALTMLKDGELDIVTQLPDDQFIEFRESEIAKKSFETHTPPYYGYSYYGFNTKNPKLNDKRVRQAIAHLFDVDKVIKNIKPFAEPIVGPFHPSRPYYHKGLKPRLYDLEKAKGLLSDAGWKDSNNNGTVDKMIDGALVELELELLITPANKVSSSMGLLFQDGAKSAGVRVNVVEKEDKALRAQLRTRDFDLFARGIGSDVSGDDPKQFWHTDSDVPGGSNRFGFGNAETDKMIDDLRSELDPVKLDARYKAFQELLYEEQPAIFLYVTKNRVAVSKKFKNVKNSIKPPGYFPNYWTE